MRLLTKNKKIMKKQDLINVWGALKGAKFGKMPEKAKMKYILMVGKLSPVVKEFDEFRETTLKKLKEDYPDFDKLREQAQAYEEWISRSDEERQQGTPPEMTRQQYLDVVKTILNYNKAANELLKKELEKKLTASYERLTRSEFGCFINSNDFTGQQAYELSVVMCDMG